MVRQMIASLNILARAAEELSDKIPSIFSREVKSAITPRHHAS